MAISLSATMRPDPHFRQRVCAVLLVFVGLVLTYNALFSPWKDQPDNDPWNPTRRQAAIMFQMIEEQARFILDCAYQDATRSGVVVAFHVESIFLGAMRGRKMVYSGQWVFPRRYEKSHDAFAFIIKWRAASMFRWYCSVEELQTLYMMVQTIPIESPDVGLVVTEFRRHMEILNVHFQKTQNLNLKFLTKFGHRPIAYFANNDKDGHDDAAITATTSSSTEVNRMGPELSAES